MKKTIAIFFGGRSPEHDVSVVSALQVMDAVDAARYNTVPVYITPDGQWLSGGVLRARSNYLLDKNALKQTQAVSLDVNTQSAAGKKGVLLPKKSGLFGGGKAIEFDVALPVFHGLYGENGSMQGLFESAGVPYAGPRVMAAGLLMDKVATKRILKALDIPHLPYAVLRRPSEGYLIPKEQLNDLVDGIGFPCIIKPAHLGSSIGVARCETVDELSACLPGIFEFDDVAIVEPLVQNLVEYNVSVARIEGEIKTSAIERPKASDELLDFKQKYLSGGDGKAGEKQGGTKSPGQSSEGMLSLTRELNPALDKQLEANIRAWSAAMFAGVEGTGAPRIDYLCDSKSGEIWLNEVNPIPGSYGYFLWEAAKEPLLFSEFLSLLIEEALNERRKTILPSDPVPVDARLLKRPV